MNLQCDMYHLHIRWPLPCECEDISRLLSLSWHKTYKNMMPVHLIEQFTLRNHNKENILQRLNDQSGVLAVAVIPQIDAGIYQNNQINKVCGIIDVHAHGNSGYLLSKLYVHPNQISQGIGKKLIDYAFEKIPVDSIISLEVGKENQTAIKFYKKLGFEVINEKQDCLGEITMPTYVMQNII